MLARYSAAVALSIFWLHCSVFRDLACGLLAGPGPASFGEEGRTHLYDLAALSLLAALCVLLAKYRPKKHLACLMQQTPGK